jgi:hypothetical protein
MICIPCEQLAKFKRLPGFINLIHSQGNYICVIVIKNQKRRIGAQTLEILYESIQESLTPKEERNESFLPSGNA